MTALHLDPPLNRDQAKLMKRDNVDGEQVLTLVDLGIGPVPVGGCCSARWLEADQRANSLIWLESRGARFDA